MTDDERAGDEMRSDTHNINSAITPIVAQQLILGPDNVPSDLSVQIITSGGRKLHLAHFEQQCGAGWFDIFQVQPPL